MTFDENTCYIVTMDSGEHITFKVEANAPSMAIHLVKIKDCLSGTVSNLFDLLTKPWHDIKRMPCSECALP